MGKFREELQPEDEIGVENTTNTRYFAKAIGDKVRAIRVIDTYQFKVISQSVKKTDINDAGIIAFYLSKGMLPEVRMK